MPERDPKTRPAQPPPGRTIEEGNEADEASLESFPASDAPSWTGSQAGHTAEELEDEVKKEQKRG